MAYFFTDENSTKGRDPNINIINGIHSIKEKTSVNILVPNYTNNHIEFNNGEYIGHLEPTTEDSMTDAIHMQGHMSKYFSAFHRLQHTSKN